MSDLSELRLRIVDALTLADELTALDMKNRATALEASDVQLLKCQLEHVLQTARRVAGLEPDGSFKPVPPPRPPAPAKKRGGSR